MKKIVVASSLFLMLTGGAIAAPAYEGKWSLVKNHCPYSNGDSTPKGQFVDGIVAINGKKYEGLESTCTIQSAKQNGNKWTLTLRCDSEGEIYNEKEVITISGDRAQIGNKGRFFRCE